MEGRFALGKKAGTWIEWYDGIDRPRSEGRFKDGEANGACSVWFANGTLQTAGEYAQNMKSGEWTEWYDNGEQRSSGSYLKGRKTGRWMFYDASGNLDQGATGNYVDDERVSPAN